MELESLQQAETINEETLREIMHRHGDDVWQLLATEGSEEQPLFDPLGVSRSAEMEYLSNRHINEVWDIMSLRLLH